MNWRNFVLAITALAFQPTASAQVPNFSKVPNVWPIDSANIVDLIQTGIKIQKGKVVAWFPVDSMDKKLMARIVDTVNTGIEVAEKMIGDHPWRSFKNKPITFYFRKDRFIPHASLGGFVSVPFWRIKSGKAPWLHEAVHEMLRTNTGSWFDDSVSDGNARVNRSLWLEEGLPEYISMKAYQQLRMPLYASLINAFYTDVDSLCKATLSKAPRPDYVMSFIGAKGTMPELFGNERMAYAPAFYYCACSFVKFVVDKQGLQSLLKAIGAFGREHDVLESALNGSRQATKDAWLKKLRLK